MNPATGDIRGLGFDSVITDEVSVGIPEEELGMVIQMNRAQRRRWARKQTCLCGSGKRFLKCCGSGDRK
jgi:uncharacterized protein YchJ